MNCWLVVVGATACLVGVNVQSNCSEYKEQLTRGEAIGNEDSWTHGCGLLLLFGRGVDGFPSPVATVPAFFGSTCGWPGTLMVGRGLKTFDVEVGLCRFHEMKGGNCASLLGTSMRGDLASRQTSDGTSPTPTSSGRLRVLRIEAINLLSRLVDIDGKIVAQLPLLLLLLLGQFD